MFDHAYVVAVFTWLGSITSASYFLVWVVIMISSYRFRAALKVQNDPLFTEIYAWQMWAWPFVPIYLMMVCGLLLICCIYVGLYSVVRMCMRVEALAQDIADVVRVRRVRLCTTFLST